jgi:hypothetical protein
VDCTTAKVAALALSGGTSIAHWPTLEAHFQFLQWLIPAVERFPRAQKFLLGDRIQTTALDVLEELIEATYTRDRRGRLAREKAPLLLSSCNGDALSRRAPRQRRSLLQSPSRPSGSLACWFGRARRCRSKGSRLDRTCGTCKHMAASEGNFSRRMVRPRALLDVKESVIFLIVSGIAYLL